MKKYIALLLLTATLAGVANAANLQWSATPSVAPASVTATYTGALYLGSDLNSWQGATPLFTFNYTGNSGVMFLAFNNAASPSMASLGLDNGSQIYTRLFNASSVAAATYSTGTVGGVHTVSNYAALNPSYTYNAGNSQTWQAIPEPTTMALLGVGVLGLAFRRKR